MYHVSSASDNLSSFTSTFVAVKRNSFQFPNPTIDMKVIEAIYENGVFKPHGRVDLKEEKRVRIRIENHKIYDIIKEYQEYFEDIDKDLTKILLSERK